MIDEDLEIVTTSRRLAAVAVLDIARRCQYAIKA
jgi:hypothetical protein